MRAQQFAQHLPRKLFVIHDHSTNSLLRIGAHVTAAFLSAGKDMLTRKVSPSLVTSMLARPPNAVANRRRTFSRPSPVRRFLGASESHWFSTTIAKLPPSG